MLSNNQTGTKRQQKIVLKFVSIQYIYTCIKMKKYEPPAIRTFVKLGEEDDFRKSGR